MKALLLHGGVYQATLPATVAYHDGVISVDAGPVLIPASFMVDQVIVPSHAEIGTMTFDLAAPKTLGWGDTLHVEGRP